MSVQKIDRDKLRAADPPSRERIRLLYAGGSHRHAFPPAKLEKLARHYLNPGASRFDGESSGSLLDAVKAFEGQLAWRLLRELRRQLEELHGDVERHAGVDSEFLRLLERCTSQVRKKTYSDTCAAIEICFGLLRQVDKCKDDIIFFADEGGAWQVGVDWGKVLPAWFVCLSAMVEPEEYARRVEKIIEEFDKCNREKHISAAKRAATADQRKALQST